MSDLPPPPAPPPTGGSESQPAPETIPPVTGIQMTPERVALVGAALVMLGSLLPWAQVTTLFGTISKAGTEGDGIVTLLLGGVILAMVLMHRAPVVRLVLTGLILAIAVFDVVDVWSAEEDGISASVGIGLWLVLGGGVTALVGGLKGRRS